MTLFLNQREISDNIRPVMFVATGCHGACERAAPHKAPTIPSNLLHRSKSSNHFLFLNLETASDNVYHRLFICGGISKIQISLKWRYVTNCQSLISFPYKGRRSLQLVPRAAWEPKCASPLRRQEPTLCQYSCRMIQHPLFLRRAFILLVEE